MNPTYENYLAEFRFIEDIYHQKLDT